MTRKGKEQDLRKKGGRGGFTLESDLLQIKMNFDYDLYVEDDGKISLVRKTPCCGCWSRSLEGKATLSFELTLYTKKFAMAAMWLTWQSSWFVAYEKMAGVKFSRLSRCWKNRRCRKIG